MDVGHVSNSSGKGRFQGSFNICRRVGHKASDC